MRKLLMEISGLFLLTDLGHRLINAGKVLKRELGMLFWRNFIKIVRRRIKEIL